MSLPSATELANLLINATTENNAKVFYDDIFIERHHKSFAWSVPPGRKGYVRLSEWPRYWSVIWFSGEGNLAIEILDGASESDASKVFAILKKELVTKGNKPAQRGRLASSPAEELKSIIYDHKSRRRAVYLDRRSERSALSTVEGLRKIVSCEAVGYNFVRITLRNYDEMHSDTLVMESGAVKLLMSEDPDVS